MKQYLIFILLMVFAVSGTMAQKSGQTDFELGLNGGISWYNGDLNPYSHFDKEYMHGALGLSLRRNLNQRFALKVQFNYGHLSANDAASSNTFRRTRNLNFRTDIYEFSTVLEFNFLYFDALINKKRFSPYSFVGIGGFYFNPITEVEGGVYELANLQTEAKDYSQVNVSIPFGMGLKVALTDRIILSGEWGLRKTFTDYIDDVSNIYPSDEDISGLSRNLSDRSLEQSGPDGSNWGTQRGQAFTKDWFTFIMATVSVRLGPKKGSCKHLRI